MSVIIHSIALYPHDGGVAHARLRHSPNYSPVGPAWPPLTVGQAVEIHDQQGWIWDATVTAAENESLGENPDAATVAVIGEKRPKPFPAIVDGVVKLPNMSGHAHTRNWVQGSIVEIHGEYWKVAKKPRVLNGGSNLSYELVPATAAQYATRPGRIGMGSRDQVVEAIGSAVQSSTGEWLHAKKAVGSKYGSAEGEYFGTTWFVTGNYVSAEKAAKLNATHGPHLASALNAIPGERVTVAMPESAVVLIPKRVNSYAASGERVALVDGAILHERVGDPDQCDSWYHYVVRIVDKDLAKRVAAYIKAKVKK